MENISEEFPETKNMWQNLTWRWISGAGETEHWYLSGFNQCKCWNYPILSSIILCQPDVIKTFITLGFQNYQNIYFLILSSINFTFLVVSSSMLILCRLDIRYIYLYWNSVHFCAPCQPLQTDHHHTSWQQAHSHRVTTSFGWIFKNFD